MGKKNGRVAAAATVAVKAILAKKKAMTKGKKEGLLEVKGRRNLDRKVRNKNDGSNGTEKLEDTNELNIVKMFPKREMLAMMRHTAK